MRKIYIMRKISKRKRHSYKRLGHGKRNDLISQLPDHLLHQILLNLQTKDSVKTCALSKRWRYLWQRVPGLDVNYSDFRYDGLKGFVKRFLDMDKRSLMYQFRLNFDSEENEIEGSNCKKWINSVVIRGVEDIEVNAFSVNSYNVDNNWPIELPVSICMCETLVHLKLEHVHMPSFELVSLPRLKTMHLAMVWFPSDAALEKLISSSQVLVVLGIEKTRNVKVLRVRSQTVKRLSINLWNSYMREDDETNEVVIDAPRLKFLRLDVEGFKNLVMKSVSSPIKMDIDILFLTKTDFYPIDSSKIETLRNFLLGISNVTNLALSCSIIKIMYAYLRHEPLPQFTNLTNLQVSFRSPVSKLLPTFLASCPNLKSLELECFRTLHVLGISRAPVPKCLLTSLEFVEIIGPSKKHPIETKLIEYLLGNAAVVKELTISLGCREAKEECRIVKQILTFPRRSSSCQVFFRSY